MTTTLSDEQLVPLWSWWNWLAKIPRFQFMVHDRWANVLFLHWRIPAELEAVLEAHTAPFSCFLDRYDGSMWIGLILLTEEKVGPPSVFRTSWSCVTHHGINVRTYLTGGAVIDHDSNDIDKDGDSPPRSHTPSIPTATRGIHFSSLECDDEFTSYGANFFGMPYQVARMTRTYYGLQQTTADVNGGNDTTTTPMRWKFNHYGVTSRRLPSSHPSLLRVLSNNAFLNWWWLWRPKRTLHSTTTITDSKYSLPSSKNLNDKTTKLPLAEHSNGSSRYCSGDDELLPQTFSVECLWSRTDCSSLEDDKSDDAHVSTISHHSGCNQGDHLYHHTEAESFHEWAAERYFVYTQKYGCNWKGQVNHEPWPLCTDVTLNDLKISGIESYQPASMQPILRYMADHRPDHMGFSPGVGPVTFTMLQPV